MKRAPGRYFDEYICRYDNSPNGHWYEKHTQVDREIKLEFTRQLVVRLSEVDGSDERGAPRRVAESSEDFEPCNVRARGLSDKANMRALIPCLASGPGRLRDLDDLCQDHAACRTLGLTVVSDSRHMGEWFRKMTPAHVTSYARWPPVSRVFSI